LTAPERVRFKRRVEGFENGWQDVGEERVATYSGLQPGRYHFRVIAANNDGVWNTEGASLAFVVQPALWQTWWFRSLLVLILGGAVGFVYHRRVVRLEAQRLAQEEFSRDLIESQEQERKRIAAELHDSLGQNLLIIKNRALLGLVQEPGDTRQHCEEISRTVSQALQEVREIAYNLRPYQLDQFGLTEAIQAIVEKVASSSPIEFKTEIDSIDGLCTPADESHLFRIVQETTNNILKHSGATQARISLRRNAQNMHLIVEDNGCGTNQSGHGVKRARGLGLSGMAERVRILRGTLEVTSAPGLGTKITITVPIAESTRSG
jgi:signal transduction histidine kinase